MDKAIRQLVIEELKKANAKFPMFSNGMEGLGVLEEERFEVQEEYELVMTLFRAFKKHLRAGNIRDACNATAEIESAIGDMMHELAQLGAMCQKFRDSMRFRTED